MGWQAPEPIAQGPYTMDGAVIDSAARTNRQKRRGKRLKKKNAQGRVVSVLVTASIALL